MLLNYYIRMYGRIFTKKKNTHSQLFHMFLMICILVLYAIKLQNMYAVTVTVLQTHPIHIR